MRLKEPSCAKPTSRTGWSRTRASRCASREERSLAAVHLAPDVRCPRTRPQELEDIAALPTLLHVLRLECKDRTPSDLAVLMQWTTRVPFFAQLSKVERMSICSSMTYRSYPKGSVLMRKGDVGAKMYVIVTGTVDVLGDQNVYITTLGQNVAFGQQALMGDGRRNATCATSSPAELVVIERDTFESSLQQGLQRVSAQLVCCHARAPCCPPTCSTPAALVAPTAGHCRTRGGAEQVAAVFAPVGPSRAHARHTSTGRHGEQGPAALRPVASADRGVLHPFGDGRPRAHMG